MESRLEELEVKVAFVEHALGELDTVVRDLADALVSMRREMHELRDTLHPDDPFDPDAEVPPHY